MAKLESREIHGSLALGPITHKIVNNEWFCTVCCNWSNAVEWFISIKPDFKQCPKCKEKHID